MQHNESDFLILIFRINIVTTKCAQFWFRICSWSKKVSKLKFKQEIFAANIEIQNLVYILCKSAPCLHSASMHIAHLYTKI